MFEGNSLRPAEDVEKPARKVFAEKPQVPEDPSDIRATYYVKERWGKRYYYADYQQKQLAITATPDAIRTKRDDRETVSAMLSLAEARGWGLRSRQRHKGLPARGLDSGPGERHRRFWIQGDRNRSAGSREAPRADSRAEQAGRSRQQERGRAVSG